MFLSDKAIQKHTEDQLNRTGFANQLADSIKKLALEDSMVIGLFGPWGCGKTSIVNLSINNIKEDPGKTDNQPIIVWFNPWNYSDKEQLLRAFFQQLFSEIHKAAPDNSEEFRKGLENFGKALDTLEAVPSFGQFFKMGGKFIGLLTKEKSLREQKEDLDKLFKKLNRKILIIMDDIDRLTNEEIRLLFQIIKINADFPNTIYITAFDRTIVEKALSYEEGVDGRKYLEKIIQVGFNIPQVDSTLIQQVLFLELDKIIAGVDEGDFDSDRWSELYNNGFKDFFTSMRDIKRYINSIFMSFNMIMGEVNVVDFLGIEAIRVFLPNVYKGIAENKSLFLQDSVLWDRNETQQLIVKESLESVFNSDGIEYSKIAKRISKFLFPQLYKIYGNSSYGMDTQKNWRERKQICSEKFFNVYFILGIPKGEVSQSEINQLFEITSSPEAVTNVFNNYLHNKKIRKLIDGLRYKIEGLSPEKCKIFVIALLDLMNSMPDQQEGGFDFGSDLELSFTIEDLLRNLDQEERYNWLISLLNNNPPLYPTVYIVSFNLPEKGQYTDRILFNDDQLSVLKNICVANIEKSAREETLLDQKNLIYIMFRWLDWLSEKNKLSEFIQKVVSDPKKFLKFVEGFIAEVRKQTFGSSKVEKENRLQYDNLLKFITRDDLDLLFKQIDNNSEINLTEKQREVMKLINESLSKNSNKNTDKVLPIELE